MNIRLILKHQIWIDTTLICSSNVQQLHRRRQFVSSSSVTYKRIKVSESPPPNHVISFRRQYAVTWSTDFWTAMFPKNIRRTQMFPHFLLWFLFLSIFFSLLLLLFLTFSGAPDIAYAIHTCTHAQNIIFDNDVLRRLSYWLERCLIL